MNSCKQEFLNKGCMCLADPMDPWKTSVPILTEKMVSCTHVTLGAVFLGVRVRVQDPDLMLKFDPLEVSHFRLDSVSTFPKATHPLRQRGPPRSTLMQAGKQKVWTRSGVARCGISRLPVPSC